MIRIHENDTTTYVSVRVSGGGRTGQGDNDSSGDELHGSSSSSRVFEIVVSCCNEQEVKIKRIMRMMIHHHRVRYLFLCRNILPYIATSDQWPLNREEVGSWWCKPLN